MKKNIFRTLLFVGAVSLMSFKDAEPSSSSRPMFGGSDECMPAVHLPNGDCFKQCRHHTYIFWIDFVGEWDVKDC